MWCHSSFHLQGPWLSSFYRQERYGTSLVAASTNGHTKTVALLLQVDGIDVNKEDVSSSSMASTLTMRIFSFDLYCRFLFLPQLLSNPFLLTYQMPSNRFLTKSISYICTINNIIYMHIYFFLTVSRHIANLGSPPMGGATDTWAYDPWASQNSGSIIGSRG